MIVETRFEWDDRKAASNFRKHGIRFTAALQVFRDPLAVTVQDRVQCNEPRWQTIGLADEGVLLLVAHTISNEKDGSEVVRIISARRAEPKERRRYEQG